MPLDLSQGVTNKMYEDALLGFILTDPHKMLEVSQILPRPDFFADPTNRAAYAIFLKLFNEDKFPGDPTLTVKELYTGGAKRHFTTLDEAARYVNALLNSSIDSTMFSPRHYVDYAEQLKWEYDKGEIKKLTGETMAEIDKVPYDQREDFIGGIETRLGDITMAVHGKEGLKHISEMTGGIADQIEQLRRGQKLGGGVPTGIDALDKTLNGLKGGEVCVLAARPGQGKALPDSEIIPTPDGPVRMGDIEVGDRVFDRHGRPTEVLGVYPQGERDVYAVVLEDGREIRCSEDHIWPCLTPLGSNGGDELTWENFTVKEMLEMGVRIGGADDAGGYRFMLPSNDAVEYPEREYGMSPYLMGRLLGDGCRELPSGDSGRHVPDEYKLGSIGQRLELLQGIFDSDGATVAPGEDGGPDVRFSSASRRLCEDVGEVLFSLGIGNAADGPGSSGFSVRLICDDGRKADLFTLPAKKEACIRLARNAPRHRDGVRIVDIRPLGRREDMTCILVDDDEHLYLCGSYVVTHNTTLSMQIAYNIAKMPPQDSKRNAVLIFSLEMMEDQLVSRMISTIGRVNMQSFMDEYQHFVDNHYYAATYSKQFEDMMQQKLLQQYDRTQVALKEIQALPIYPTTESGLSPNAIKSMVMQKKRELDRNDEKLALIVIDYLQLMTPNLSKANASRTEEVGDMSRRMKLLAKEFDVPVLLLAQLNRNADVTERPNLKDLRESGSIEQDADKVMFIWSEHADKTINDFSEYGNDDQARREALRREQMKVIISVAKNRQGETGDCPVLFDKGFQTFVSQSDEYSNSGETYSEFALKYYQKTRTDDIFWPLKPGEIPEELEAFRAPRLREQPYLTSDGRLLTLADSEARSTRMTVENSRPAAPSFFGDPASGGAGGTRPQTDKSRPRELPELDDMETGFEELPEHDVPPWEEPTMQQQPQTMQQQHPEPQPQPSATDRTWGNDAGAMPPQAQARGAEPASQPARVTGAPNFPEAGADPYGQPGWEDGEAYPAFVMDDDDDELDLDALDMLDRLSSKLSE